MLFGLFHSAWFVACRLDPATAVSIFCASTHSATWSSNRQGAELRLTFDGTIIETGTDSAAVAGGAAVLDVDHADAAAEGC
ncbi:hypothetical protein ACIBU0_03060 [Streptomyces sp. NPDC049627]|uniref:hypothetical protein n=1 Tax=Streptomyces sp. NPDC049627 TaxID=3365595 RepID=UPI0037BE0FD7